MMDSIEPWQESIIQSEQRMSNKQLLERVMFSGGVNHPVAEDPTAAEQQKWETSYLYNKLCERLRDWFTAPPPVPTEIGQMADWRSEIAQAEQRMNNQELLERVWLLGDGDEITEYGDGRFSAHGLWEYEYLYLKLRERLAGW